MSEVASLEIIEDPYQYFTCDEIYHFLEQEAEKGSNDVIKALVQELASPFDNIFRDDAETVRRKLQEANEEELATYITERTVFDNYDQLIEYGTQQLTKSLSEKNLDDKY